MRWETPARLAQSDAPTVSADWPVAIGGEAHSKPEPGAVVFRMSRERAEYEQKLAWRALMKRAAFPKHVEEPNNDDAKVEGHEVDDSEDPGWDLEAVIELVRQGERALDHQIRASEEQDAKSRHLLTLTAAILAVGAAIGGLAITEADSNVEKIWKIPFAALLGLGLFFGGMAFFLFARSYGFSTNPATKWGVGWDMDTLEQAADEGDLPAEVHRATLIGLPKWFNQNSQHLKESAKRRSRGMLWLLMGGASLAASLLYAVISF